MKPKARRRKKIKIKEEINKIANGKSNTEKLKPNIGSSNGSTKLTNFAILTKKNET